MERIHIDPTDHGRALADLMQAFDRRLEKHGLGAFASVHEAFGVLAEEYHEAADALRGGDCGAFAAEIMDMAVVCIFELSSRRVRQRHSGDGQAMEEEGEAYYDHMKLVHAAKREAFDRLEAAKDSAFTELLANYTELVDSQGELIRSNNRLYTALQEMVRWAEHASGDHTRGAQVIGAARAALEDQAPTAPRATVNTDLTPWRQAVQAVADGVGSFTVKDRRRAEAELEECGFEIADWPHEPTDQGMAEKLVERWGMKR